MQKRAAQQLQAPCHVANEVYGLEMCLQLHGDSHDAKSCEQLYHPAIEQDFVFADASS